MRAMLGCILLCCLAFATPSLAQSKLAFVVGIDTYPALDASVQLKRAVADANAVGDTLQSLGFQVSRVTSNATLDTILNKFDAFKATIQAGDTVVLFYSGHGISLDDGNYLIPADIPSLGTSDQRRAKRLAIAERDFSRDIRAAGARVAVVVIDACRNNPFPVQGTRALGDAQRGLVRLESAEGVFSLYSAREGQAALDRLPGNDADPNSVFTRVFLKELKTPGLSLIDMGERVRDEVAALAQTVGTNQVPAVYNDMIGARSVYLNGVAVGSPPSPPAQPQTPVTVPNEQTVRLEPTADDPKIRDCDDLAAKPSDPRLPSGVRGVEWPVLDASRAIPACQLAYEAHPGEPRLAFELGRAFDKGNNKKKAVDLYRVSADVGYPIGMEKLGAMYDEGAGVAKDKKEAVRWYQKAADAGSADGMNNLGAMYADGTGVAKDMREAVRWYQKAADAGVTVAMNNLGTMYQRGTGVAKDMHQAVAWYRKAATAGNSDAKANLKKLHLRW